ncbi:hypothetical protein ACWEKM_33475 [Streptomyces sp. NPDC004752]
MSAGGNQRQEIAELRQLVTGLTLARAVLTQGNSIPPGSTPAADADNIVPIRPPTT